MVALSLFQKPNKSFDIGSATVGVAVVKYKKGKPIKVFFTNRITINYKDESDAKSLGKYVAATIKKASESAINSIGSMKINGRYSVHSVIHAPWVNSLAKSSEGTLQKETLITRNLLQQFIENHLNEKKVEERTQFDRHITRIELNGYSTTKPYKKMATKISITMLESSMFEVIYSSISNAFSESFPNHTVHIDAFLFTATQLQDLFSNSDAYTIVDVGEEYTSLSLIRDDTVRASTWVNFGTEYLIRTISKENKDARQSSISELTMYLNNTCTPAQCRKIETALQKTEQEWTRAFGDACGELSKKNRMPTKTFVAIDKHYAPWFKKGIEKIDFGQFTVTGKPLEVQFLSPENTTRSFSFLKSAKRDSMLSLAILFVDKQRTFIL